MAGPTGFEPAIFSVTGRRVRPATPRARDCFKLVYVINNWRWVQSVTLLQLVLLSTADVAQLARAMLS